MSYKNIDKFNDNAPLEQWNELWQKVGEEMEKKLKSDDTTRWLNTHGLLFLIYHVRIEKKPKFYSYGEYRKWE